VTGEVEGCSEPTSRWHTELAATLIPQLGDGSNASLKRLSVESNAVTDPTKLSQTENHRPQLRRRLHRNTTQHQKPADRVPLPHEKRGQRRQPEEREEGLVGSERWRFGVEEEPAEHP